MSDLAALNKSVSLSSASSDFVLLAKSLAAARGGHFRDAAVGTDSPVDEGARSLVGFESSRDADVVIDQLGNCAVFGDGRRVFRQPRRVQCILEDL